MVTKAENLNTFKLKRQLERDEKKILAIIDTRIVYGGASESIKQHLGNIEAVEDENGEVRLLRFPLPPNKARTEQNEIASMLSAIYSDASDEIIDELAADGDLVVIGDIFGQDGLFRTEKATFADLVYAQIPHLSKAEITKRISAGRMVLIEMDGQENRVVDVAKMQLNIQTMPSGGNGLSTAAQVQAFDGSTIFLDERMTERVLNALMYYQHGAKLSKMFA